MNGRDRRRMERLSSIIQAVPLPHAGYGTASVGMGGLMGFAQDMRVLRPALSRLMYSLSWSGVPDPTGETEDPDVIMAAIERWVELRKATEWKGPVPPIDLDGYLYRDEDEAETADDK